MIYIDCKTIENKQQMHLLLQEKLGFPQWYGHNLDALMDCLCAMRTDTAVTLNGFLALGDWKEGFAETFADAMTENPHLQITLV